MFEYHEGVVNDDNDKKKNIMSDWNTEYEHAQNVLNVCRKQLRLWLMKQYVIINSDTFEVNQRYNLNFEEFKTSSITKQNFEISPAKWFTDKFADNRMYAPLKSYMMKIYCEEQEFLKNVIQKFVELIEEKLPKETYDYLAAQNLGLIEFTFDDGYVQEWTSFYKNMKKKDENKDKNKFIWPKLPPACYFAYSNDPNKQTNSVHKSVQVSKELEKEHQKVYQMFEIFEKEYKDFYGRVSVKNRQSKFGLRIWFHARAWNAFRKAIQSNLIKTEDKDSYMLKNRIKDKDNKYIVLGSTMALTLPAASRPSYLVSL